MQPLVVIAGPTASGKTALAIALAKRINGEVISADSMQIYRGMNIGTAKPTTDEMQGIPHHLLDVAEPEENFSLEKFATLAHATIQEIVSRGKIPILAGGTGLYIDTVAENRALSADSFDPKIRKKLEERWEKEGAEKLYVELSQIDPTAADKLHIAEKRRIIRALEIFYTTGKTKTWHAEKKSEKIYNYFIFAIELPRNILYNRINRRVEDMLAAGLMEEVRDLHTRLYGKETTAKQGVGYKELFWYLDGRATFEEAVSLLKRNTRRLAKRQMTWFRANPSIYWLDGQQGLEEITRQCMEKLAEGNEVWR
ncbi:MAG: tRNA (adenosine(37)-N6)-dimethylallyltransferase MiaA [Clostridia bacterium]|nr:tRNA (adenosine(37)-N6)-dimethylallyltransferase MiaA [Clostridia bacterium]